MNKFMLSINDAVVQAAQIDHFHNPQGFTLEQEFLAVHEAATLLWQRHGRGSQDREAMLASLLFGVLLLANMLNVSDLETALTARIAEFGLPTKPRYGVGPVLVP